MDPFLGVWHMAWRFSTWIWDDIIIKPLVKTPPLLVVPYKVMLFK